MLVHFSLGARTSCNQYVTGSKVEFIEDVEKVVSGDGYNVQHTTLPENVTCEQCKKGIDYLNFLRDEY